MMLSRVYLSCITIYRSMRCRRKFVFLMHTLFCASSENSVEFHFDGKIWSTWLQYGNCEKCSSDAQVCIYCFIVFQLHRLAYPDGTAWICWLSIVTAAIVVWSWSLAVVVMTVPRDGVIVVNEALLLRANCLIYDIVSIWGRRRRVSINQTESNLKFSVIHGHYRQWKRSSRPILKWLISIRMV